MMDAVVIACVAFLGLCVVGLVALFACTSLFESHRSRRH
jgi:hypothetical protein